MANILVIRLSAIGDVAMTVPVIYSAAKANPTDSFTVLTQAFLIPVFINRPKNVNVIGINTKSTEKTLAGLLRFASALVKYDFDMVLDLHDVLRTMIIRTLFRLNGRRVFVVDKARKDRARLTGAKHKRFKQLRPVIERYADVFRNAGLHYTESFTSLYETSTLIYPPWNPLRERRRANGSVSPPSPSTGERFIRPGRWSWSWPSFPIERILPSSCSVVVATRRRSWINGLLSIPG